MTDSSPSSIPPPAASATVQTTVPRPRAIWTSLPLAAVWIAAAVPVLLWLLHQSDPVLAVRLAQSGSTWLGRVLIGLAVAGLVLALLYPPFPAWLRLMAHRTKLAVTSDRGPLLRALGELRHFESAAKHLEVGRLALQRGDVATAAPHLQRAVQLDPGVASAHHHFALLLFRHGQLPAAVQEFAAAEAIDSGHAFGDAQLHAGRALHLLGDHNHAALLLKAHAQRHGGSRRSQHWLGEALAATGDLAGASAAWTEAAAPPKQKLTAEENWFRALARVRLWRRRGGA
ncbi:MAG: tetratricopeptide repeat protein [Planctomycetota bacterium]